MSTPLKDAIGRVEGAVCSFQELTERKRAEEALRASEAELQSVINRTPFMLVRCSRDLRYRFISEAYAHLIGRRREDVIGKTIVEVLGEKGFNTLRPYTERVLRGEAIDFECELDFPKIGTRRLAIAYRPERDADGNVGGWIASLLDITEQRRGEQAQRQLASIVEWSDDVDHQQRSRRRHRQLESRCSTFVRLCGRGSRRQADHHPHSRRDVMTKNQKSSSASGAAKASSISKPFAAARMAG